MLELVRRRQASLFVREKLGGTKAWLEALCAASTDLSLAGDWETGPRLVLVTTAVDMETTASLRVGATYEGSCLFWNRQRGWGKLIADGSSVKIFAHCRDVQAVVKSIPRGARVRFVLAKDDRGLAATMVTVEPTPPAVVDDLATTLQQSMSNDDALTM